jgi:aspartate kinase
LKDLDFCVLKFGGTSVGSLERIKQVSNIIFQRKQNSNDRLIVVVSAMAGVTNKLLEQADFFKAKKSLERDVVATAGEQITSGLLAIALLSIGLKARSYMAWQLPIKVGNDGSIKFVDDKILNENAKNDVISVVAGFQGITDQNRIITLGRGGSDATAVAIAAKVNAKRCDIYTDVKGVYFADPRIVENAKKIDQISYEEMLEMSLQGAKVMQAKSMQLVVESDVNLQILSSFEDEVGTFVTKNAKPNTLAGITHLENQSRIVLRNIKNEIAEQILDKLACNEISIDMIDKSCNGENESDLSFVARKEDICEIKDILDSIKIINKNIHHDFAKISIIGSNIRNAPDLLQNILNALKEHSIQVIMISIYSIRISLLIQNKEVKRVMVILYNAVKGEAC